jgi:NTP pyrophosphatase (non-canonical NTP hydrolase)
VEFETELLGEELTLKRLSEVNLARANAWHGRDIREPHADAWSGADWSNAMCGEAGETANVVKKLRRHETNTTTNKAKTPDKLIAQLGHELADTLLYLLLVADYYQIDITQAVIEKFNLVSDREGFPEKLP